MSIFGTLFERGLDPSKRSQLGAHYTDPATIIKKLLVKSKRKGDANYKLGLAEFVGWLNHLKD